MVKLSCCESITAVLNIAREWTDSRVVSEADELGESGKSPSIILYLMSLMMAKMQWYNGYRIEAEQAVPTARDSSTSITLFFKCTCDTTIEFHL